MKDANTRKKDIHEGKRRYHENVSFYLKASDYPRDVSVSHKANTNPESFSHPLRRGARKNVKEKTYYNAQNPDCSTSLTRGL